MVQGGCVDRKSECFGALSLCQDHTFLLKMPRSKTKTQFYTDTRTVKFSETFLLFLHILLIFNNFKKASSFQFVSTIPSGNSEKVGYSKSGSAHEMRYIRTIFAEMCRSLILHEFFVMPLP